MSYGSLVIFFLFCEILFLPYKAAGADRYVQLATQNLLDLQGGHATDIDTRIQYKNKPFYVHFEWLIPIDPQHTDGVFELQTEYALQVGSSTELTLKHELYFYTVNSNFFAELTPKLYTRLSKHFKIGIELEVDYLKMDLFDLYELEVEPTIKWHHFTAFGKITAELEAPVCRLYSSNPSKHNFEFETVEFIVTYGYLLNPSIMLGVELDFPYDVQNKELEFEITAGVRWKF